MGWVGELVFLNSNGLANVYVYIDYFSVEEWDLALDTSRVSHKCFQVFPRVDKIAYRIGIIPCLMIV